MSRADADAALGAIDADARLLAVSSMDVYRAFGSVWTDAATDRVPLSEESPLREGPLPDADERSPGWEVEPGAYEKRDVEAAYLRRGATVCRLPMVYGEHDYQRREEFVLRRVRAGRKQIPIGAGTWLFARGYVRDIATGLRLALEGDAIEEVFNLCEQPTPTFGIWAAEIIAAAGSDAELVRVPDQHLPSDLELTGSLSQHLLLDSGKARDRLGWRPRSPEEGVRRSVAWHLEHPPEDAGGGFDADDQALGYAGGRLAKREAALEPPGPRP